MTADEILRRFRQNSSVKRTAYETGVSAPTVRRVLITAGELPTERAAQIAECIASGMTVEEIAESLHVKATTVRSYLPYQRGCYTVGDKSANAERIRKCRERKNEKRDG